MSDELVRRARSGDEYAFEELVLLHQKKVYNLAFRMLGNEQDALDASQEAFLKVYSGLKGFSGESSFSTWLYRLTSNVCIDFLRKAKKNNTVSLYVEDENEERKELDIPDNTFDPELLAEKREKGELLLQALKSLPEEQRRIFVMRESGGLSYEEIGDALGLQAGTVKSRLFRARERLRKQLAPHGNFSADIPSNKAEGRSDAQ